MKSCLIVALIVAVLFPDLALCEVKRLQVCASSCSTPFCKKVAEDVEFEFELLKDFLLPPCQKKGALAKKEFRLQISQERNPDRIIVELDCQRMHKCLSKEYPPNIKGQALASKVVSDVKLAVKHNKAIEAKNKQPEITKAPQLVTLPKEDVPTASSPPQAPSSTTMKDDEWDRVVLVSPSSKSKLLEPLNENDDSPALQMERKSTQFKQPRLSIAMSFGGENWNYNFESEGDTQNDHPFHSRVYPKMLLAVSYWALPYVRVSSNLSAAIAAFRLKTNQPVEGDGQVVVGQLYQTDVIVSALLPLWKIVHIGVDTGYEFSSAFVDAQRLADRQFTVIPSFQSHGLRMGPRLIVGALTDKGLIDLGIGFYPYMHYFEKPDEPASSRRAFAWSADGGIRLMISSEIFAEARIRAISYNVHYEQEAIREGIEGEKWGTGRVRSFSAYATAGIGWSF